MLLLWDNKYAGYSDGTDTLQSGNFYMNDRLLADKNKMLTYSRQLQTLIPPTKPYCQVLLVLQAFVLPGISPMCYRLCGARVEKR